MARKLVDLHLSPADVSRFWDRVAPNDVADPARCWPWRGYVHVHSGYGYVHASGNSRPAHRVSFVIANGAVPDGMLLDHLCRNRACVNPDHLEPVTNEENLRRSTLTPTGRAAAGTLCPWGHEYDTVSGTSGHRRCRTCHQAADRRHKARKRVA